MKVCLESGAVISAINAALLVARRKIQIGKVKTFDVRWHGNEKETLEASRSGMEIYSSSFAFFAAVKIDKLAPISADEFMCEIDVNCHLNESVGVINSRRAIRKLTFHRLATVQ